MKKWRVAFTYTETVDSDDSVVIEAETAEEAEALAEKQYARQYDDFNIDPSCTEEEE